MDVKIGEYKAQKPKLDHIIGEENPVLSIFLRGHLVLEGILEELLRTQNIVSLKKISRKTMAEKIKLYRDLKLISLNLQSFLLEVNRLRNKFAHRLGYDLTQEDVHLLINLAAAAPEIDFSDDMHSLDRKTLFEWYTDTAGVLLEMFKHAALDLAFLVTENGGEELFE